MALTGLWEHSIAYQKTMQNNGFSMDAKKNIYHSSRVMLKSLPVVGPAATCM